DGILAGALGFVGFLIVWLGTGLVIPELFNGLYYLVIIVFGGATTFTTIGLLRNRIMRHVAKGGFLSLLRLKLRFNKMFWGAVVLAIYAASARTHVIPELSPALSVTIMGSYFLLVVPR